MRRNRKKLLEDGWAHYQNSEYDVAIQYLSQAIDNTEDGALAHYRLGFCFRAQNRHNEAINNFRRAGKIKPADVWCQYQIGKELALAERFRDALPEFAITMEMLPTFADAYHDAGACLASLSFFEPALSCYTVCTFACEVSTRNDIYTGVTIELLESSILKLKAVLGLSEFDRIRVYVWSKFGMHNYPEPEDQLDLSGFETLAAEIAPILRGFGS